MAICIIRFCVPTFSRACIKSFLRILPTLVTYITSLVAITHYVPKGICRQSTL